MRERGKIQRCERGKEVWNKSISLPPLLSPLTPMHTRLCPKFTPSWELWLSYKPLLGFFLDLLCLSPIPSKSHDPGWEFMSLPISGCHVSQPNNPASRHRVLNPHPLMEKKSRWEVLFGEKNPEVLTQAFSSLYPGKTPTEAPPPPRFWHLAQN